MRLAALVRAGCPLWVISGHTDKSAPCPLGTDGFTWPALTFAANEWRANKRHVIDW